MQVQSVQSYSASTAGTRRTNGKTASDFQTALEAGLQDKVAAPADERKPGVIIKGVEWTDELLASFAGGFRGAVIDTTNPINWDSKGDQQLTPAQIRELRRKYDVNNLSPQDYYNLMADLTNMNVLSAEDIHAMHVRTFPGGSNSVLTTRFTNGYAGPVFDVMGYVKNEWAKAKGEMDDWMSEDFWDRNQGFSKEEHQTYTAYLEDRMARMEKIQNVLESIG